MELVLDNIAPYLSILVGINNKQTKLISIHNSILQYINAQHGKKITAYPTQSSVIGDLGEVSFTPYIIEKAPSWLINHEAKDTEHHVFISFSHKKYVAFYFSEKGLKDDIRDLLATPMLPEIIPVPISVLNAVFIDEDRVKMLWLTGIHGRNNFKADTKVISGESVTDTLDPLLDQSFMMSAVRTEMKQSDTGTTIGLNPFRSSIWRGSCNTWNNFENRVFQILNALHANNSNIDSAISILSYPIPDCNDLSNPYDFSLIDYEFFPEEEGQRRKELLKKLQNNYRAELTHSLYASDVSLDIFFQGTKIGNVTVTPLIEDYKVKFQIKQPILIAGPAKNFDDYLKVFNYPEVIKCWFESGHALVNGMVFKTGYRDVVYNKFIWADFSTYNILKEKPGANPNKPELDKIGKEKSLFCWVKNCWHGEWLDGKTFNTSFSPKGWLLCDDGAGEKADFIHYIQFQGVHLISLIHVKAAKSDSPHRKISVGAHDIVLNQGVKNLRSCERKNLSVDLEQRLKGSSNKKCWHDGLDKNPESFVNIIKNLTGQQSSIKTRVIIIQPHTTQKYYNNVSNNNVKRQLDVLLVSAESAIQSSGSEFHIFGYAN